MRVAPVPSFNSTPAPCGPFHHARPKRELPHHPVEAPVPNASITIREREDA